LQGFEKKLKTNIKHLFINLTVFTNLKRRPFQELRTDENFFNNQATKMTELIEMEFQNLQTLRAELTDLIKTEQMNIKVPKVG
jgi:hypothetical protein